MSYNYQNFLRPIFENSRNIQILDSNGVIKYTINPFFIINTMVSNNVLKINLKNDRIILLDFNNSTEVKSAIAQLQLQIDNLTQKTPISIDKNIENYVEDISRIGTWEDRPTSPFIGQKFFATDIGMGASFTWNGTSWRPSGNRIRIFSSVGVTGSGENVSETVVRTVNIPSGICEVGCVIRLIGVSTWISPSTSPKVIRVKVSNDSSTNLSLLSSITNRSRSVSSTVGGFYGFNKPLIIRSTNQLWTGTINIDQEVVGAEGLSPHSINGIDCTQSWTLWLTHQKPLENDVFDSQYFIVDIEYP